jgi:hypothetical protein
VGGGQQVIRAQGLTAHPEQGQVDRHGQHVGHLVLMTEGAQLRVAAVAGIADQPGKHQYRVGQGTLEHGDAQMRLGDKPRPAGTPAAVQRAVSLVQHSGRYNSRSMNACPYTPA